MKLLLNDKELVHFLLSLIDYRRFADEIVLQDPNLSEAIEWSIERKEKLEKFRDKIKAKIHQAVKKDLRKYVAKIKINLEERKKFYFKHIHNNLDQILDKLGEDNVIEAYRISQNKNFIKSTGYHLDSNATMIRRKDFADTAQDCLLRNTVSNEKCLISKIDNGLPFWFIDSGYTNFLESNKKWHRLVRNHLHYGNVFETPVDRLGNFKSFPMQWRGVSDKILIIEPGQFAASIFHIDIKSWKYNVEQELRKYTDKKIVFREKAPKKQRAPLFKHLCNEDYHCVISINSNAATEAIWAGIPVITLDTHVTNPVAKNKLSDINNLYRGSLAQWLAMLSYSQFTYDELVDGTAGKLVKKYHV